MMAISIEQVRQQYPQYNHLSNEDLAARLHQKFYSYMPQKEFFNQIGLNESVQSEKISQAQDIKQEMPSAYVRYPLAILQGLAESGQNLGKFLGTGRLRKAFGMPEEEPVDFRKALGYEYQPTGGEKLTEFATKEAPGFLIPETKLFGAVEKLKQLPKVGRFVGEVAAKGIPFGAYQATQEESPLTGFAKGVGGYATGLGAIKGLSAGAKAAKLAIRPVDVEKTYGGIQEAFNAENKKLGDMFSYVSDEMKNRGIENVGQIDKTFIQDARNILPSSKTNKILLDKVELGNYDDIRKLYTKIGKKIRTAKDDDVKELYEDLRDRINEGIQNHAEKTGQSDLSSMLNEAKSGYANLKKTYESTPMLRKLVGESQEIPQTLAPLMKKNTQMARIRKLHPEVEKDIAAQTIRKNLKKLGIGALGYEAYKKLTRD
jgi:hypothetical protein